MKETNRTVTVYVGNYEGEVLKSRPAMHERGGFAIKPPIEVHDSTFINRESRLQGISNITDINVNYSDENATYGSFVYKVEASCEDKREDLKQKMTQIMRPALMPLGGLALEVVVMGISGATD